MKARGSWARNFGWRLMPAVGRIAIAVLLVASISAFGGGSASASTGTVTASESPAAQATTTARAASLQVTVGCNNGTCDFSVPLNWGDGFVEQVPVNTLNKTFQHQYQYSGLYRATIAAATATIEVAATQQDHDAHAMRVQLQEGSTHTYGFPVTSQAPVTKAQVRAALSELYSTTPIEAKWFPYTQGASKLVSAIVQMSNWLNGVHTICIGGNIHSVTFAVNGRGFRLDLENLRGCNLTT